MPSYRYGGRPYWGYRPYYTPNYYAPYYYPYTYGYAVLGEVVGWAIGWDLLLEYTAIVAVVAIGISGYFNDLLGFLHLGLPNWMMGAPGTEPAGVAAGSYHVNVFAVLLCLLIAYILNLGMKSAARFETALVYLKVVVVLVVIAVGAFHIRTGNYNPFFPFGISGAFAGAATVFFAVFGYDAMSTAAEESKDSQKHLPKAIIYSLAISMVLYVLACLVLTGMVNYRTINSESAFSSAFADEYAAAFFPATSPFLEATNTTLPPSP